MISIWYSTLKFKTICLKYRKRPTIIIANEVTEWRFNSWEIIVFINIISLLNLYNTSDNNG